MEAKMNRHSLLLKMVKPLFFFFYSFKIHTLLTLFSIIETLLKYMLNYIHILNAYMSVNVSFIYGALFVHSDNSKCLTFTKKLEESSGIAYYFITLFIFLRFFSGVRRVVIATLCKMCSRFPSFVEYPIETVLS